MDYLKAFVIGGAICMLGQVLIDLTRLTPARILVCYVVLGVILGGAGVYEKLVEFAGAGATVPLTGFGNTLAKGVREAVLEYRIVKTAGEMSLAEITLHTGRTHQIRVQFASRKHPLAGDGKYGSRVKGSIALQSCGLQFVHPNTGRIMNFTLPLPDTAPWNLFAE